MEENTASMDCIEKQCPDGVSAGEQSSDDNSGFMVIKEGLASMYYDKNEEVFYNKVQVFNRDTSIQVIKLFAETFDNEKRVKYEKKMERFAVDPSKFEHEPTAPSYGVHVLDALAATGLRSVRYVKEIPGTYCYSVLCGHSKMEEG